MSEREVSEEEAADWLRVERLSLSYYHNEGGDLSRVEIRRGAEVLVIRSGCDPAIVLRDGPEPRPILVTG